MSLASDLFNLFVPKHQPPPPYNKVAKLVMSVEVETVQIRNGPGDAAIRPERNYPHYPMVERRVEMVEGDGTVLSREITPISHHQSPGSSWRSSSTSSRSSAVSPPRSLPRQLRDRWVGRSMSSSPESSRRRSSSFSSVSSWGSFDSGSDSGSEIRAVGVVKSDGEMRMFEGGGVVLEDHLSDSTSTASWPEPVRKLAGRGRNIGVVYNAGPPYAGWTMKKNKFTRRETDRPNYRVMHLAEAEEKRRKQAAAAST
ncbi:hypothetical protein B0I37DRAFT_66932 [Chaetomium sp. MPI-CAGE-AT-0009]|nr:hypothetical protein B0I37DRAFT_66932 [Chaetomium sp. MPI-CAGE-AT-0009]